MEILLLRKFNITKIIKIPLYIGLVLGVSLSTFSRPAYERAYIRIVVSSTVYPFVTVVSEWFSKHTGYPSPIVEANGTGGGFSQFCRGIGFRYPDVNDASRPITPAEIALCNSNGVGPLLEIKFGFDGIAIIYSKSLPEGLQLSSHDLFLAIAKLVPSKEDPKKWVPNFYKTWHQINPKLPNIPILVMGPPSTSGTRDVITDSLKNSCKAILTQQHQGEQQADADCGQIRYDGPWQDGSENYNLVLQKVLTNPNLFALMGYSYYNSNKSKVNAVVLDKYAIDAQSIASGKYHLSRPLFIYVKQLHIQAVPGLKEFIHEMISFDTLGAHGYLTRIGLVPMPPEMYDHVVAKVQKQLEDSSKAPDNN